MLSKSRFLSGLQCHRLLWWRTHDRDAPELLPDPGLHAILDGGTRVGELAREQFPGGTLIPNDDNRVVATRAALASGATVLYEASFAAADVFAAVDILLLEAAGWRLIEVKATTSLKPLHVSDAAIQLHALEAAGLRVHAVEIMRLDRACRHPNLSNLFKRVDITASARALLPAIPARVAEQLAVLGGSLPVVPVGPHCDAPYACPFQSRCFAALPPHHVSTLYGGGRRVADLLAQGIDRIDQIPEPLDGIRERQRRAAQTGQRIVERGLAAALIPFAAPIAFLDFETVSTAIPLWPGCAPYEGIPVQFSVHADLGAGLAHHEWLATGPDDPRRALAVALLDACAGAAAVVAYNAPFERALIEDLALFCPDLRVPLTALASRLIDLLPVVRDHVYDNAFGGSFSLKVVLPALVGQGYDDLAIAGGGVASAGLARLLFDPALPPQERESLRRNLLTYCARDTLGLVLLLARLRELASAP